MNIFTTLDLTDRQFLKIRVDPIRPLIYWRVAEMKRANRFTKQLRPSRTLKRETRFNVWERLIADRRWIPDVVGAQVSNVIGDARRKWRREDGIE